MSDVLKISDAIERQKIEDWTLQNTFPNIIKFVEDADGNFIVGQEVLSDPAYQKLGIAPGVKLRDYLQTKTTVVVHKPKPDPILEPKAGGETQVKP